MPKLKYTFMNDILFKMLFTKHPELLKKLTVLIPRIQVPLTGIEKFEIRRAITLLLGA